MSGASTSTPFRLPGPGLSELAGSNALPWRTALANVILGTGPAHLMFRGNSETQGYLGTVATNAFARRVDAALCTALGQAVSPIYYPISPNVGYGAAMAYGITGTALNNLNDSGFAGESAYLSTTTIATSPTINPSTGLWLHVQKGAAIGGACTYTVNGGAPQGPVNAGAAPRKGGRIWDHGAAGGLVAGGANVVAISGNGTFGSVIEGISFFNTNHNTTRPQGFLTQANAMTGTGLRTWVTGHIGYRTDQYAIAGFSNPVTTTPTSTALCTDPYEFIPPHCICTLLGTNDALAGYDLNTYMNYIQTMVANDRAAATAYGYTMPLEVFIAPYGSANDPTFLHTQYASALKTLCYNNGFGLFDLTSLIGEITTNTAISSDGIHPNNTGHAMIASYLANFLRDI